MRVITRAEWGAQHADGAGPAPLPCRGLYLHHTVTQAPDLVWLDANADGVDDDERAAMRLLERIGQERFGRGISYTWALPPSGRLYQGHSVDRLGAHTGGMNSTVRAVALIGDYSTRAPTDAQEQTIAELLREGVTRRWWPQPRLLGGHRDVATNGTACPGTAAYRRIQAINARALSSTPPAPEEEDMALTPDDYAALSAGVRADVHEMVREVLRNEGVSGSADGVRTLLAQVAGIPDAVRAAVAELPDGQVDTEALAASIVLRLGQTAGGA